MSDINVVIRLLSPVATISETAIVGNATGQLITTLAVDKIDSV